MDLTRAFTYIFEDDDWVTKLLLTIVINLIPIVNIAAFGWMIQLIGNVMDGVERPMPAWDDFGQKFTDGLMYIIGSLIYNVVLIVFICVFGIAAGGLSGNSDALASLLGCGIAVFVIVYSVIANAALFVGLIKYTRSRDLGAYMQISDNMRVASQHISTLLMLVLLIIVAGLIIGLVGWIPCLGQLIVLGLLLPVNGHLAGQAALQMSGKTKNDDYTYA